MAAKLNYLSDFYEDEILNGNVPELYINKEILNEENICLKDNNYKVYRINGDLFYEDDRYQNSLHEFCLELNNENEDSKDFIIEIKKNSFVVMINSIILLSSYQWNTIIIDNPIKCLVCDLILQDPFDHIKTDDHVINLEKYKPLKKFNLHITRMIGDKYHCAVCNEVYEIHDNNHLDSEKHLERMLYATNRATDVVYDFDNNNDVTSVNNDIDDNEVKRDTISMGESGFDSDGFYDLNEFTNNKSTLCSYASIVKHTTQAPTSFVEHVIADKTFTIDFDTYHMILRPNTREFYCMLCIRFDDVNNTHDHCKSEEHLKKLTQCEIMDIHQKHFIRKVTTKFYHCGTCNNLQLTGAVEAHLRTHDKKRKNKINENNDDRNEHENKIKENNDDGNEQENNGNRNEEENRINENNDNINEHKNNNNEKELGIITSKNDKISENNENMTQSAQVIFPVERTINNRNPSIDSDIVINRFNCNIRVSFMSYNLILRRLVDYLCLICNFVSPDMNSHTRDPMHIVRLENFPFQPYFGINLVRLMQRYAHCGICNVLVDVTFMHLHTTCQAHLFNLNKALNPNNNQVAMHQVNMGLNQPPNTQNTQSSSDINVQKLEVIPKESEILNQGDIDTHINQTDLNQTEIDSDILEYDIEDNLDILKDFVYLKIQKMLLKVSFASYHTLVHAGDGTRYCFLCSYKINKSLVGHIQTKVHMDRLEQCKFIRNYDNNLLRQVKLTYHCCTCNVLFQTSDIDSHLAWPIHRKSVNVIKKNRKRIPLYSRIDVEFQTKETCINEKEQQMELVFKMISGEIRTDNIGGIVINVPNDDNTFKIINISHDAWQGITRLDRGVYCNICHDVFVDIGAHLEEDGHKELMSKPIEKQHLPAFIRKINESSLNCVNCNLVIPNKKRNITEHIRGKKHVGNYEMMLQAAFTGVILK